MVTNVCVLLIVVVQFGTQLTLQQDAYNPFSFAANTIDVQHLRVVAALASFCILASFFDWLRVFEQTAFYIMLLMETLNDIRAFVILIFISLMMFGVPMMMLNMNRSESAQIIDSPFDVWMVDVFIN